MTTLYENYRKKIVPDLKKKFKIKNIHDIPRIEKIVINVGCGDIGRDANAFQALERDLNLITGQKCRIARSRKSISNFKIREGMIVGAYVTLRGRRAYDFLERFINISVPRIRDFRGFSPKGFDKNGNYNVGIPDHTFFTEIDLDKVDQPFGMNITICTTTEEKELAKSLLEAMQFPFVK